MLQRDPHIESLVHQLGEELHRQDLSLALAESCTGGLLAACIVADPHASGALERGFVVYSTDAKCELLALSRERVEQCQGVSEDIARGMARAALERSRADLALAITGFAGPQHDDEEVGLVHVAGVRQGGNGGLNGGGGQHHRACHFGDIGRDRVCRASVVAALEMLLALARER